MKYIADEYVNDGDKRWYINDKLHREDGPAIELEDGSKEWYINGKLHREGGPAIKYINGYKSWYLNDKYYKEYLYNIIKYLRNEL